MSCIQKNWFAENPSLMKWVKADHSSWLWMVNAGYGWSVLVMGGQCWLGTVNHISILQTFGVAVGGRRGSIN